MSADSNRFTHPYYNCVTTCSWNTLYPELPRGTLERAGAYTTAYTTAFTTGDDRTDTCIRVLLEVSSDLKPSDDRRGPCKKSKGFFMSPKTGLSVCFPFMLRLKALTNHAIDSDCSSTSACLPVCLSACLTVDDGPLLQTIT